MEWKIQRGKPQNSKDRKMPPIKWFMFSQNVCSALECSLDFNLVHGFYFCSYSYHNVVNCRLPFLVNKNKSFLFYRIYNKISFEMWLFCSRIENEGIYWWRRKKIENQNLKYFFFLLCSSLTAVELLKCPWNLINVAILL